MMKVATVFDRACPFFIILRQRGTISVCIKKVIAKASFYFTKAPITPNDVTRRFSNILLLVEVLRKGQRKRGMWALRNSQRVWGCRAKHWRRPTTRQMRFELVSLRLGGGESSEQISMIYWRRIVIVPTECQSRTGSSGQVSLFLLSRLRA